MSAAFRERSQLVDAMVFDGGEESAKACMEFMGDPGAHYIRTIQGEEFIGIAGRPGRCHRDGWVVKRRDNGECFFSTPDMFDRDYEPA